MAQYVASIPVDIPVDLHFAKASNMSQMANCRLFSEDGLVATSFLAAVLSPFDAHNSSRQAVHNSRQSAGVDSTVSTRGLFLLTAAPPVTPPATPLATILHDATSLPMDANDVGNKARRLCFILRNKQMH